MSEIGIVGSTAGTRQDRYNPKTQVFRRDVLRAKVEQMRVDEARATISAFGSSGAVTISLREWPDSKSEALIAIEGQRPLPRSGGLRALAEEVLAGLDARQGENVEEWARRIAEDVAGRDD